MAPKNTSDRSPQRNHQKLDEFEVRHIFDMLETMNAGAFGSNLIKIDYLNRNIEETSFGLNLDSFKTLNGNFPYNLAKNRLGDAIDQTTPYLRMFPKFQGDLVNKWILVRAARIALLNSMKVHVDMPGDSELTVGQLIEISIPENAAEINSDKIRPDAMVSGRYMITGLRHRLLKNKYTCHAQLCKDSLISPITTEPPLNAAWNSVINS